jgi:DNA-directed RNA polymerase subunit omega
VARVTVEDCLEKVGNRFELIMVASKRARDISMGTEPLVEWENDKATVVALREIADSLITNDYLKETPMNSDSDTLLSEDMEEMDAVAAALHAEIGQELSQMQAEMNKQASAQPPSDSEQTSE